MVLVKFVLSKKGDASYQLRDCVQMPSGANLLTNGELRVDVQAMIFWTPKGP